MSDDLDFSHLDPSTYGYTDRERPFQDILNVLGPMSHVQPVTETEIEEYQGKLPEGLLQFWREHGRGTFLSGYVWLCDPKMFKGVLEAAFEGDPEYRADDFIPYLYNFEGRINCWSKEYNDARIDLAGFESTFHPSGGGDQFDADGLLMPPDFIVGHSIRMAGEEMMEMRQIDFDQFTEASRKLGLLEPGEIFGFFPSRQMGGEGYVEDMQRVQAVEYLLFHVQLGPPTLTRYVLDPDDRANPMGHLESVRPLGPQE